MPAVLVFCTSQAFHLHAGGRESLLTKRASEGLCYAQERVSVYLSSMAGGVLTKPAMGALMSVKTHGGDSSSQPVLLCKINTEASFPLDKETKHWFLGGTRA